MILLFAFGTVTAMMLPLVTAVLGLVASLALIKLLGHWSTCRASPPRSRP